MNMPVIINDTNRIPEIVDALPDYLELAYRKIMSRIHWWIQEIFRTQGPEQVYDPVNREVFQVWPDIAEATARAKRGERTILIDTGVLRNSIQIVDVIKEPGRYEGRIGVFMGPALDYARIHEFGGTIVLTVTQRMRNFYLAMFLEEKRQDPTKEFDEMDHKPLRKDTTQIVIRMPQRSYLRKAQIRSTEDVVALVVAVIEGVMMGVLK